MNRPGASQPASVQEKGPPPRIEPLRQYGIGPTLLTVYLFGLVILQFLLVSLGTKPLQQSC